MRRPGHDSSGGPGQPGPLFERNVTVLVPPATVHGTTLLTNEEMREMAKDYETMKTVAGTMANMAICMTLMLCKDGTDSDVIPRDLINRVEKSQLQLREDALGNVTARVVHRAPSLIVTENGGT
jgi:hypothetical protein